MSRDIFADWISRANEPFEQKTGPFFHREQGDGSVIGAFIANESHVNGLGIVHRGCLMTLVDHTLFTVVKRAIGADEALTVSMTSEFAGSGAIGDHIEAHAEIVKAVRRMVFARGVVRTRDKPLVIFSGTMKRIAA
jgi:acyl-coenzyme A thioesterase PaaI-like protein